MLKNVLWRVLRHGHQPPATAMLADICNDPYSCHIKSSFVVQALTDTQKSERCMYAAVADIRNDYEFEDNHIGQGHAVIFKLFRRSLWTESPLLAYDLSPFPSSNGTVQRKFLSPCELRFPESKLNLPDVCWPAKSNSD